MPAEPLRNVPPEQKPGGGAHYRNDAYEPLLVGRANNWGYELTAVYKYTQRYESKGGIADLEKAHYLLGRFIAHKKGEE